MDRTVTARRNQRSTRATLFEPGPAEVEIPALPPMRLVERSRRFKDADGIVQTETTLVKVLWRLETMEWWRDVWASPMPAEFHSSAKGAFV